MRITGKRLACLLMALALTLLATAAAQADSGIVQGSTVSGTVRVYLSSIGAKTSVDLTVDGSYSIDGDTARALARGTQLNVRNSGGTLVMTVNGQSESMGSRFKLRRHQTSGNNGVRIAQARYPQNLYPGDIELIAKGGDVQIIVHVYMEDYMRGVLPYEMDNSFPLEALKAQAVAARTYALKKMSAQAATYDLVDTTSDQVYNGTPAGNERCVQAVQETSGIVGTVGGEYMASYYTASNGGQTESVANAWGSGAYAYLQVKDDPYDLRNSASASKSVTFSHSGTTSVPALTELLRTEAAAQVGAASVQIASIDGVSVHTPRYAAPSRVYTKVDVSLTLQGYGSIVVTLDYFSQIEGLCSMSINTLKNETLEVTSTSSGFKLTARRYGHGVGMSQRGAQQMGNEGFTYDQILEFYYPGLTRTRYTMTRTLLPSMDGTPGGPEEPVSDAQMAVVTLQNPLDSLNLRAQASTSSAILARMEHGTQVTLLEHGGVWSRVQYGTLSGYVKSEYLRIADEEEGQEPVTQSRGTATVALSDESQTLNLRAAPTTGAAILARLRHGTVMTVLERYERWTYVQHGTLRGYVMNDYIVYDAQGAPQATPTPQPPTQGGERTATVALQSADSRLNLRQSGELGAPVLLRLAPGEQVTVLAWGEEWCHVSYGGVTGYCATAYLRLDDANTGAPDAATPQTVRTAIVLPESGLNLRAAASLSAGVIMTLPQGTMLTVTGTEQGGMLPVRLGSQNGYVASGYVYIVEQEAAEKATPSPTPSPTPAPVQEPALGTAMVTAGGGLKLRSGPDTAYPSVMTMPYGTTVTVTGGQQNGFYPVRCGETEGFASAAYLSLGEAQTPIPIPTATPSPTPQSVQPGEAGEPYRVIVSSDNGLNLRALPSAQSEVIYVLPYGMVLTVLGESEGGFLHVRWANYEGYVAGAYVTPFGAQ